MICSDTLKHLRNFSALAIVLNATFSLPAHADDAWLRACSNSKTAEKCQMPFQQGLSPVLMGASRDAQGLWGYVDLTGHMVIEPEFREVSGFSNDLAAAKKDDLFGYIDKKGHWAIEPKFSRATDFNAQGTALVVIDNRLALIDRKGAVIQSLPFGAALDSDGFIKGQALASIQAQVAPALWNAQTSKSLALPDDIMALREPQSGFIPAQKRDAADSGYWGYLDQNGEWAIDPMVLKTRNEPILNGNVIAVKDKTGWAFLDKQGVALSKEKYKAVHPLKSGSWLVTTDNGAHQLLSSSLEKVQDLAADQAEDLQEWGDWLVAKGSKGVTLIGAQNQLVNIKASKPQLLLQNGNLWIIQNEGKSPQVVQIYNSNGVGLLADAVVNTLHDYQVQPLGAQELTSNSAGFNDAAQDAPSGFPWALLKPNDAKKPVAILTSQGEVFSDPQWSIIDGDVRHAPLLVQTENHKMGAIDAAGKWIIQPTFAHITPFTGDHSWATTEDNQPETKRIIDSQGNLIDVPDNILHSGQRISSGVLLTAVGEGKDQRWGLWDIQSKSVLAAPQFFEIEDFNQGYAVARADGGWGVITRAGQWAIAPDAARLGKPQYIGDGMFSISDDDQPRDAANAQQHFSLFNAANGQAVATNLLGKPLNVGKEHWLVQPADGGIALIDNDGRAAVSKAIVPATITINNQWALLEFAPRFGAVDSQGQWQIQPLYSAALNFVQPQNWASAVSDNRVTLIDSSGGEPLEGFSAAEPLSSMARLALNDNATGETVLFDNSGHEVQRFAGLGSLQVKDASEGTVPFKDTNGLYGLIDANGKKVIGSYFDKIDGMNDGLAKAVRQSTYGANFGYINLAGRFAMVPEFEWAEDFSEKRAWAGMKDQAQLLNTNGNVLAQLEVRCNQRIITDAKGHQFWPTKPVTCTSGGGQ